MKTLFLAIAVSFISLGASAQATSKTSTQKAAAPAVTYRCPTCTYTSTKTGECPKDKIALVKVGDYYCPDCYMSSSKPGKCTMCGVDMKKMEAPNTTSSTKK